MLVRRIRDARTGDQDNVSRHLFALGRRFEQEIRPPTRELVDQSAIPTRARDSSSPFVKFSRSNPTGAGSEDSAHDQDKLSLLTNDNCGARIFRSDLERVRPFDRRVGTVSFDDVCGSIDSSEADTPSLD